MEKSAQVRFHERALLISNTGILYCIYIYEKEKKN